MDNLLASLDEGKNRNKNKWGNRNKNGASRNTRAGGVL